MLKAFGAAMTILGTLATLFVTFLILNSSAVQPYNKEMASIQDVGLIIPLILALSLLVTGIIFAASPEASDRME